MYPNNDDFQPHDSGYSDFGADPQPEPNPAWQSPPPYSDPTPPKKEKKPKKPVPFGTVIALCLVCALLGSLVSVGAYALISRGSRHTTIQHVDRPTTTVDTTQLEPGDPMSVAEIYAAYANSVVGIEVSTARGAGAGTGFVITEDGYIVTCHHVIDEAQEISVTFPDTTSLPAQLVGSDADNDLALLKIDATGLTPVVLGDSSQLNVGDTVTTIGNALGTLSNTTTTGIVSALDRAISTSDGTVMNVLQTNCTVNSGNSGGPLFNQYGEVIGIVNAKYSNSGTSTAASIEGIGFAIPYNDVEKKVTDLMQYGYITGKPSLGITVSTISPLDEQRFNMPVGAYVNSIVPGSCAETAGLKQGDIITAVDGKEITTFEELVNAKNRHSAGDEMKLTVWRSGETTEITVVLDEQKPEKPSETPAPDNSQPQQQMPQQQVPQQEQPSNQPSMEDFFNYWFGHNGGSW